MNKFLANFQRTGAMFPIANAGFFDGFWSKPESSSATQEVKEPTQESKQESQGSGQIAHGLDNVKDKQGDSDLTEIWKASDKKEEDKAPTLFSDLTADQVNEVASKVQVLTNEDEQLISALSDGDESKANALRSLMTNVGRRAFASATLTTSKAFGTGVENRLDMQNPKIKEMVDSSLKEQSLYEEFPMATDPATKTIFQDIARRVIAAYPNATRSEVMEHTQRQLDNISKVASTPTRSKTPAEKTNTGVKDVGVNDSWEDFFAGQGR